MSKKKSTVIICLAAILILSGVLHFYRLDYPDKPAWDEAHFATYASDYVKGKAFLDIHPPLGKLIYAAALQFSGKPINNPDFVTFEHDGPNNVYIKNNNLGYGDFPYVWPRATSAIFGIFLPLVFYFFLRNIGLGNIGALIGAFFVVLENSLLTETRLLLMNGMLLVFGFAALAFFFHKNKFLLLAGIFFGLALSIKLTAIIFIGPVLTDYFLSSDKKMAKKNIFRFLGLGLLVCLIFVIVGSLAFDLNQRIAVLKDMGLINGRLLNPQMRPIEKFLDVTLVENAFAVSNYVSGGAHPAESPWYLWPLMQKSMVYFADANKIIGSNGNDFIWYSGTLAVLTGIFILFRNFIKWLRKSGAFDKTLIILLTGYFSNLLPFMTVVRRSTFLYHYFPSLIFSIGLTAYLVSKFVGFDQAEKLNKKQILFLSLILLLALGGFLYSAKFVYGL